MQWVVRGFEIAGVAILVGGSLVALVSITVERTFDSALTLGLIVLVRTFLSFSLEIELQGALPWRRGSAAKRRDEAASVGDRPG
jgi:uncharacterized membrane protein